MSPVPVGAGAPGSRPQSRGEIPAAEPGVKSLFGGSKRAGWDCSLVKVTIGKRLRAKVKAKTGRNRVGIKDIREVIAELNPILRGWGNYFRTGNAAEKFQQLDRYVAWRLKRLLVKRKGRNLRAGEVAAWTEDWFVELGLHRLRGTIRYPGVA